MSIIIVRDISKTALSANAGIELRTRILSDFQKGESTVTLDFDGISVFATMFFNACYGYFIKEYRSREEVTRKIIHINLSNLGKNTLEHSLENALTVLGKEDIIQSTIDLHTDNL